MVDPQCRVRGLQALRVVDSSIFPTITNGNLNAPTIMVAEKAADLILGHTPLPPADAPVWIDENVITSYSIHYTKLYEVLRAVLPPPR